MKAIDRKLFRELRRMKGQSVAIAVLVMCAVSVFVMSLSTYKSLVVSQAAYYGSHRFADVFASCKRAPESLASRIIEIPGVSTVQTRVVMLANVVVEGFLDPIKGMFVSLPPGIQPPLNKVYLRSGSLPSSGSDTEVLVSEAFANAHRLKTGDFVTAVIHGRKKRLLITGTALSPEYVLQMAPGDMMPDNNRFGVFWMPRQALAAATGMEGAFNDVVVGLNHGASEPDVISRIDSLLEPYGGLGAGGRDRQISHRYFSDELRQLKTMAVFIPAIFLAVVAFLLNVVLSRLIGTQREQIAALKAFGYTDFEVGTHYAKLVAIIVTTGSLAGVALGWWMTDGMTAMYARFYNLPVYILGADAESYLFGISLAFAASLAGVAGAIRKAVKLPPAEAMRPEPPASFKPILLDRLGLGSGISQPVRMVFRGVERKPVRTAMSSFGISFAVAILVVGYFFNDSFDWIMDLEFRFAQRADTTVSFFEATSSSSVYEVSAIPGVLETEPFRAVPVCIRAGNRTYHTSIIAGPEDARLKRLLTESGSPIRIPEEGLMITRKLGDLLGLKVGDPVIAEVLEGRRPKLNLNVSAFSDELFGSSGYTTLENLNGWMGDGSLVSGIYLRTDPSARDVLLDELKRRPRVAGISERDAMLKSFDEVMAQNMLVFAGILVLFAAAIAVGVVYNNARVSLAEKERELATLRVIGLTRGEVSLIMLGEMVVELVFALPLGCFIGWTLAKLLAVASETDLYRLPVVILPRTYMLAMGIVVATSIVTAFVVRRRIDRLDLVEVLKSKE